MGLLDKVRREISRHHMLEPGDLVVIGVSGGPDSVALLHLLFCLQQELNIFLHVAHLNHMFRGEEAREDASFVHELADRLEVPCTIGERNVPVYAREKNLSAQVAAREVRYRFFHDVLQSTGGAKLALAHHADDQAESVLINLFRGSGLKGLAGMSPVRENLFVRPLLNVRRREIEEYCREHQLPTRLDHSNLKTIYLRNRIRHRLIPLLEEEYCPGIVPVLVRMADHVRDENDFLEGLSMEAYGRVKVSEQPRQVALDRKKLAKEPRTLARRVLRLAWEQIRGNKHDLTFEHVELVLKCLEGGGPERVLELPAGIKVRITSHTITLQEGNPREKPVRYSYPLAVPGRTAIPESGVHVVSRVVNRQEMTLDPRDLPAGSIALDYDKVTQPLVVRSREDGDTLVPFGFGKGVKLKKLLIDRKVPRYLRDKIPLVVERDTGKILWVAGVRMAHGVGISSATAKVILLSLENGNSNNTQIDNTLWLW